MTTTTRKAPKKASSKKSVTKQEKFEFNPNVNYSWNPDTEFTLVGNEFGFILNTLLAKEEELRKELQIIAILKDKLKDAVERGEAVEVPV